MPSTIVHAAVNKKVANKLGIDNIDFNVGGISPDISKLVGNDRCYSHFCDTFYGPPNLDKFLYKYREYLREPFVLGYYVHLYTDYLFETYFVPSFLSEERNVITKIDGTKVSCNEAIFKQYIYNDYTDLNTKLISKYKLDFSFLDEPYTSNKAFIDEVPMDKIDVLFKANKEILQKSKERKHFLFDTKDIVSFIEFSSKIITEKIESMNIL